MESFKLFAAMVLMALGLVKVVIGICVWTLSPEAKAHIPFLKETTDATLARHMYEYVMFLFGVYLIVLALHTMGAIYVAPWATMGFLSLLGIVLIVFYSIVLFSSVPISKDPANRSTYITRGLGGGAIFLLIPWLWSAIQWSLPKFRGLSVGQQTFAVITFVVIGVVAMDLLTLRIKNENVTTKDVVVANIQSRLWY